MKVSDLLEYGETIGSPVVNGDSDSPSYLLWPVTMQGRSPDDRVFLDVRTQSNPVVLTGGNPLHLEVLRGVGRLTTVDLSDGSKIVFDLQEGTDVDVAAGTIHWYENQGPDEQLLVRDTSLNFYLDNEVGLSGLVQAIIDNSITTSRR